jgi:hypothetical protein
MAHIFNFLGHNIQFNSEEFMENIVDVMAVVSHIVAIASVIVKLTPDQTDDALLAKVMKVLKFLSLAK